LTNRKPKAREGKVQLIDASTERFWSPLRKSLGSKRREIPETARHDIVRLYEGFLNGESGEEDVSKIFDTIDFGFREIRVERPLKLNFEASAERIDSLSAEKAFLKLPSEEQAAIRGVLATLPKTRFTNRDHFDAELTLAIKDASLKLAAPIKKSIFNALSERDDTADVCTSVNGKPEADSSLRDHELVPLKEDWKDYFKREVLPFVPDAWVDKKHIDAQDKQIGRVGYEINFNKYFYRYTAPRPLEEIDAELKALEINIASLLKEVAA